MLTFGTVLRTQCLTVHAPRQVGADQAPYLCLDLTFQHTLLTAGFKIPDSSKVSLVKRVKYHSQVNVPPGISFWTLPFRLFCGMPTASLCQPMS